MEGLEKHRMEGPRELGFALLTVSDTRTEEDDNSGAILEELALAAGHRVEDRRIVVDEVDDVRLAMRELTARDEVDVVVVSGGTGFSPRDVSMEAVALLFDRTVVGFGELFRMLSFQQVGAAAMLSRAGAGLINKRAVYVLPGSPKAVRLAMEELILPETGHLLGQARMD